MNKLAGLATITSASAMTLGLTYVDQAEAKGPKDCKGIFEAPMADANGQVAGSEGKLCADGEYKVEIPNVAAGEYAVCFHFQEHLFADFATGGPIASLGPEHVFLALVTVGEEGELKVQGNLDEGLHGHGFGEVPYVENGVVQPGEEFGFPEPVWRPEFSVHQIFGSEAVQLCIEESGEAEGSNQIRYKSGLGASPP